MLNNFSYGRAYCFALRCAGIGVTSLSFHKEVTKKRNQDVPSWNSLPPAVLTMNGGAEKMQNAKCKMKNGARVFAIL